MLTSCGRCVLFAAIFLACAGGVYGQDEGVSCAEVIEAQDAALSAAELTIDKLKATIEALREERDLERQRAELAERQLSLISASYERELKIVGAQLRASKWRRILDVLTAGGVGYVVGDVTN